MNQAKTAVPEPAAVIPFRRVTGEHAESHPPKGPTMMYLHDWRKPNKITLCTWQRKGMARTDQH